MALLAAAFHPFVWLEAMPQSRGTYSNEEGIVSVELPQLYAQEIDLELAKPDRREASL